MAVITYPLNGIEYNAENAETYFCTRTSGVYSSDNNFAATVNGNMSVNIGAGIAWIKDKDFSGKSVVNTEPITLNFDIADGVLSRKDRVVLQFDVGLNATNILVKKGTPSSSPQAPTIQRNGVLYELGLYVVDIPAGLVEIRANNITSTMLDESVCGIMRDGVTGIPTAQLQEQASDLMNMIGESLIVFQDQKEQEFNVWFNSLQDILDENTAGNLLNMINANKAEADAHISNKSNPHSVSASQVGAVPTTRTVNGKPLSANVTLAAGDVGAVPATGGSFTGAVNLQSAKITGSPDVATAAVRNIYAGTSDMEAGTTPLPTGTLYFVYE